MTSGLPSRLCGTKFAPPPTPIRQAVFMRYQNVCLEAVSYCLPEETISSEELERRLEPLYRRLRLPEGRLELMSGIRERRFWQPGVLPSDKSIASGELAIAAAGVDRGEIGVLIHGSVCRDYLEPATACRVHHGLGLSRRCVLYDVSNACLGLMNGVLQAANMIELGQVRAALVLGTESSRALVETTIDALNQDASLTRSSIKSAIASLTIGSASSAVLLTHRQQSRTGNRLLSAAVRANTDFHQLCQSGRDEAVGSGMQPLMETDSEQLMREGIATGVETFREFLAAANWQPADIDRTFCHQVGADASEADARVVGIAAGTRFCDVPLAGQHGFGRAARDAGYRLAGRSCPARRTDRHAGDRIGNQLRHAGRGLANNTGRRGGACPVWGQAKSVPPVASP